MFTEIVRKKAEVTQVYNEHLKNGENMGGEVGLNAIHVANGIWLDI